MKKIGWFCSVLVLTLSLCTSVSLLAQEKKEKEEIYTIEKGDTLWDISSRFLQNPFLWPKLWQRNPYITNPHWIFPGNPIRLVSPEEPVKEEPKQVGAEERPKEVAQEPAKKLDVKKVEPPPEVKKPEVLAEQKPPEEKPLVFPELRTAGFFSDIDYRGIGSILESREGKTFLSAGDICYVGFKTKDPVSIGERYTIFSPTESRLAMDNKFGRRYNILGVVQIIDQYGNYYTAKVIESFQEIKRGDFMMPYNKDKMEVGIGNK
ncbi:MAG TPA: LysM peptidoglycan-binding domain-containing protein [Thermodesulfobacteriota bacterium]|nr:LysM peptidoglycan-binding domain-containing protein [Thermodesulfobacteriota bacterium]